MVRKLLFVIAIFSFGYVFSASPRYWVIDSIKQFLNGEFVGTYIEADGTLRIAAKYRTISLPEYSIWKAIKYEDGYIFISNRPQGIFYVNEDGKVKEILKNEDEIFVDIVKGDEDTFFVAGSPGKVYILNGTKIQKTINIKEPYIWKLLYRDDKLYIATGNKGRIYTYSDGELELLCDVKKGHIYAMAFFNQKLYFGVSESGLIYKLIDDEPKIYAKVDENIISSMKVIDGSLYIIASFTQYKSSGQKKISLLSLFDFKRRDDVIMGFRSNIYRISEDEYFEKVASFKKELITDIVGYNKELLISSGSKGRLYLYKEFPGINYFLDLPSKKVISLIKDGESIIASASDGGEIVEIKPKTPYSSPYYVSDVFDTQFLSRIGTISWESNSEDVRIYVRGGNVEKPDKTWSDWIEVENGSRIKKIGAVRYIQLKAKLPSNFGVFLRNIRLSYRGYNRAPFIKRILYDDKVIYSYENAVKYQKKNRKKTLLDGLQAKLRGLHTSKEYQKEKIKPKNPKKLIKVIAEDPDKDKILFYFYIKRNIDDKWIPLLEGKPTYQNTIYLNTDFFPDGIYRIKVIATDISDNPKYHKQDIKITKEFVIDNTPPHIVELIYYPDKNTIYGKVIDKVSRIKGVYYLIDGGVLFPAIPMDGILDSKEEEFIVPLPKSNSKEIKSVIIIVKDELGNQSARIFEYVEGGGKITKKY